MIRARQSQNKSTKNCLYQLLFRIGWNRSDLRTHSRTAAFPKKSAKKVKWISRMRLQRTPFFLNKLKTNIHLSATRAHLEQSAFYLVLLPQLCGEERRLKESEYNLARDQIQSRVVERLLWFRVLCKRRYLLAELLNDFDCCARLQVPLRMR